ncbi:MAG: NAD(+)--dinitrogen-reductase ADP-D-ribosyltransferase [Azoarcus sp.]|nr:NAD(+)--dinitrogen-reductase ADP-D-ribosyltransferase [Azoarcus sp.]
MIPLEIARLTLPASCRLSLNRCNLPTEALASFAFQLDPRSLELDGIHSLHHGLFERLDEEPDPTARVSLFRRHMNACFMLDAPPEMGLSPSVRVDRSRMDYLCLLHGWMFSAESREGAVLKAWVESRFGLVTRYHCGMLDALRQGGETRAAFEHSVAAGLYNASALESQLDLLYSWGQYELGRRHPGQRHFTLYRGLSSLRTNLPRLDDGRQLVELNNLSSFSASLERADEFGNIVISCAIPAAKILVFPGLLPGLLRSEDEYLVIGGVVAVRREY